MTEGPSLLAEEELDFLLTQADVQTANDIFDPTDSDETKVTIRGDLDNISLADIFQTLSISKMRGILKVFNPLETRLIYFEDGLVRLMNANRKGTRRIGQRLVRCGVLSTAQLRQALLEQKKTNAPLGETLIDLGFLSQEELTQVLNNQLEEDLHNIFIWSSGNFEFYKNKPDNEEILDELTKTPGFEVNGILLEAARRRDEWTQILQAIGSVHAIPVIPAEVEFPEMSGNMLAVCESIDNFSTITDLAEVTMLGLFNCAKAVCDLKRDGLVELANPEFTIELALDAIHKQDTKRALQLCQNLRQHASELDFELCEKLASVLESCREPRLSANILLECAKGLEELDHRIGIAERALGVDRHAIPVMDFLRAEMQAAERTHSQEYQEILSKLCESLSSEGDEDRALEVFSELEDISTDPTSLLNKKAKLLQRAGRNKEALDCLFTLRNEYEADGDQQRLARLYEQILKIDPEQKEVAKALKAMRVGKAKMRMRKLSIAGGVAAALAIAYFIWQWMETQKTVEQTMLTVGRHIEARQLNAARSALAQASVLVGEQPEWAKLRQQMAEKTREMKAEAAEKVKKAHIKELTSVSEELQKGHLEVALAKYKALMAKKGADKLVRKIAPGQLHRITKRLKATLEQLENGLPGDADELARHDALVAAAEVLEKKDQIDSSLARSMLVIAENPTVKELWPAKDLAEAQELALQVQALAQTVARRLHDHNALIKKIEKNKRLDPVYRKAQGAEQRNDFKLAEQYYRQLLAEYEGNKSLAPGFRDRVMKYAAINKYVGKLEKAVAEGEFRDARGYFLHLKRSYGEYKWGAMVYLPLSVVTTPAGAKVFLNGKLAGESPITLRYRPADKNWIKIERDGFHPEQATVTGDGIGEVRSVLNRKSLWTISTAGPVDQPGVTAGSNLYLVDRTGAISAWSLSGKKELWRHETGDLSGLLTRPVLQQDLVIVASLDGTLRALHRGTGKVEWSLDNLPCESAPIVHETQLILASRRELLVIETKRRKKKIVRRIALGSTVEHDLIRVDEDVLVPLANGTLRRIELKTGKDRWQPIELDGLLCEPLVVGRNLALATDEGVVSVHSLATGVRIWHKTGLGELSWRPATDGRNLFLAAQPTPELPATIQTFSVSTGVTGPQYRAKQDEFWSTHPMVLGGKLVAGSRSGTYHVLGTKRMKLLFNVKGSAAASARPIATRKGALLTFEDRKIFVMPTIE